MVDYVKLAATALRLITKNGKTITVTKLNTTASDANKPWRGAVDPRSPPAATASVKAVEVAPGSLGKLISKGDIPADVETAFMVAPELTTAALDDFDELTSDGTIYSIGKIIKIKPASVVMLYIFMVAK